MVLCKSSETRLIEIYYIFWRMTNPQAYAFLSLLRSLVGCNYKERL